MRLQLSIALVVTVLYLPAILFSQEVIQGKGGFQIDVDLAKFYGSESQNYVEVYYSIRENILAYKADSNRYYGAVTLKMEVRGDSGVAAQKAWTVPHVIDDTSKLVKSQMMTGLESFGLPFGEYTLSVTASDVYNTERTDSLFLPLSLQEYGKAKEVLSDIELCNSIQSSTNKQSMFYKNTLEVIPNPGRLYGAGVPILYYYLEAYNLLNDTNKTPLTVHCAIVDAVGREVLSQDKKKPRVINSSVEVGTMNLTSLKGGTYIFQVSLRDSVKGVFAQSSKKFFIYKPQSIDASENNLRVSDVAGSEYAVMTESEINRELERIRYIATDIERRRYSQLSDLDAKRKFLFEFWKRFDPDPVTPENEYKEEYKKRIEAANREYSSNLREGWKTDRGRVSIIYGPSDETERFPSSDESMPYEIWHYNNIQGGVIFVFVDQRGSGEYAQVHSTHRNEIREDNWYPMYAKKTQ